LINILILVSLRQEDSQGGMVSAKKLTDVDYADDLALTSDAVANASSPSPPSRKCCQRSDVEIKAVESFTYLGSQINSTEMHENPHIKSLDHPE